MKHCLWAVILWFCLGSVCSGETFHQKNSLFQIDVPDGWQWVEESGVVKIVNQEGNGISIQFTAGKWSMEEASEALRVANQRMVDVIVKPSGGKVMNETETMIGGVQGRLLEFELQKGAEIGHISYIVVINNNHVFTITFGGSKPGENLEVKRIVDSLRFL